MENPFFISEDRYWNSECGLRPIGACAYAPVGIRNGKAKGNVHRAWGIECRKLWSGNALPCSMGFAFFRIPHSEFF